VGAVELSQGDAVERHLGVVRCRLQLPGRLLQTGLWRSACPWVIADPPSGPVLEPW
jgi:hypothetical protein